MARLKGVNMDGKIKRRHFFYIEPELLQTVRNNFNIKPFKGSSKLYCFRAREGQVIQGRELSCFCDACRKNMTSSGGDLSCQNISHVGEWTGQQMICTEEENGHNLTLDQHGLALARQLHFRLAKEPVFIALR